MSGIPRDRAFDRTLSFWKDGYAFVSKTCDRLGSDVFETRLMLRKAICARGAEAAEIFYGDGRFTRVGAMPHSVLLLLQDEGSVQTLDGEAHRHRKRMFMSMMTEEALDRLTTLFEEEWTAALEDWAARDRIVLLDEVRLVLTRTACRWAGVPLRERDTAELARELSEMIDQSGKVGLLNWRARALRRRTESWIEDLVGRVRAGSVRAPEGSVLATIAAHRDPQGELLPARIAAVELINVLRPIVAVGRFVAFTALALHEHPEAQDLAGSGTDADVERLVQEVRRLTPFFPLVGGRVRESFRWRGRTFGEGEWVLLDLYGTNHDARLWRDPESFRPARFEGWTSSGYDLVPQGAGDFEENHRCPGEWATIALMKSAARLLAHEMRYRVPEQDLDVDLSVIPARPRSGFVMAGISRAVRDGARADQAVAGSATR